MKPINEVEVIQKEKLARDHRLAVMIMIQQQIDMVGDLMTRHKELVKSPLSYNMCAGLLDQLKTHAQAAFLEGGKEAFEIPSRDNPPYFKFPDDIIGL